MKSWKYIPFQYDSDAVKFLNATGLEPEEVKLVEAGRGSEGVVLYYFSEREWDYWESRKGNPSEIITTEAE